jgi:hypothetical protein
MNREFHGQLITYNLMDTTEYQEVKSFQFLLQKLYVQFCVTALHKKTTIRHLMEHSGE